MKPKWAHYPLVLVSFNNSQDLDTAQSVLHHIVANFNNLLTVKEEKHDNSCLYIILKEYHPICKPQLIVGYKYQSPLMINITSLMDFRCIFHI